MLCSLCVSIFQSPKREGHHHASFEHLVLAARAGCKICKQLCRLREDFGPDEAGEKCVDPFTRYRFYQNTNMPGPPGLGFTSDVSWIKQVDDPRKEYQGSWRDVHFHVSPPMATPDWWVQYVEDTRADLRQEPWRVREDQFPRRFIPPNTGDIEVMQLAQGWLASCMNDHDACRDVDASHHPDYLPPRVLDITDVGQGFCRLLIVKGRSAPDDSSYIALSHCWGRDASFLTLTSDNITNFQQGIPLSDLPKSFVDAIQASQHLGFRYIWIDSLCIIQSGIGSLEDWQSHATEMGLIYANSTLNVAIAGAATAEEGAFVDRDADFLQTAQVYMPVNIKGYKMYPPDDSGSTYAGKEDSSAEGEQCNTGIVEYSNDGCSRLVQLLADQHDTITSLWAQPLQKRGWVVQEGILSPRTLYFGKDRVYWSCKAESHNEYSPSGPLEPMDRDEYSRKPSLPPVVDKALLPHVSDEDASASHLAWHAIVGIYMATNLTYPNHDKLIAIAALAKRYNNAFSSSYIGGLFYSDLPLGLLWTQGGVVTKRPCKGEEWISEPGWEEALSFDSQRSMAYRAPSW
jgi:hypothetical protein